MFKVIILTIMIMSFQSCCFNKIERYKDLKPTMNFEKFFSNKLIAYGSVYDFFGRLDRRFIIKSEQIDNPKKDGKTLYKQSIEYLDTGKIEQMKAYAIFDKNNKNSFTYKDNMMVSEATYEQSGNAAHVSYDLKIKRDDGSTIIVSNDDWIYMMNNDRLVNNIKVKKFGITVAQIIMNIEKVK
jgi:hypothetical protein